jgi:hypothetical protein
MALSRPATATRAVGASRAEEEHAQTHAQFFGCDRTIAAAHQDRVVVLSAPLGPCHSAAKGSATGFPAQGPCSPREAAWAPDGSLGLQDDPLTSIAAQPRCAMTSGVRWAVSDAFAFFNSNISTE